MSGVAGSVREREVDNGNAEVDGKSGVEDEALGVERLGVIIKDVLNVGCESTVDGHVVGSRPLFLFKLGTVDN